MAESTLTPNRWNCCVAETQESSPAGMASAKTCPHEASERVTLSGTRVRELLRNGEPLPEEFTRPEVSEILAEWMQGV